MSLKYLGGRSKKRRRYCKDGTRRNKKGRCVKSKRSKKKIKEKRERRRGRKKQ